MTPGERIGGRFLIQREAGAGGMGRVYRARDLRSGEPVAVKVLHGCDPNDLERFSREARVLEGIVHAAVVHYVARGTTEDGAAYLVMEWLEGEDLGARLKRGRLSIAETTQLARRVSGALSAVHARGVVHRDIKPSNLFLPGGKIEDVKLIDFGIARRREPSRELTRTGVTMGTLGYMAPEQARGAPGIDARADVFSLGCVLFECLTGHAAFSGKHLIAVLAKVLLDEAPRVSDLRPEVPGELADLIERMLRKEPEDRPADASFVASELAALGHLADGPAAQRPARLSEGEQRLSSVLLVGIDEDALGHEQTADLLDPVFAQDPEATPLHALAVEHGAELDWLADGTLVLTLSGAGVATDEAAQAARCALALQAKTPARPIVLATGRGRSFGHGAMGEVLDRAAGLLRVTQRRRRAALHGGPVGLPGKRIRIDDLTAGLLRGRFEVDVEGSDLFLRGERTVIESLLSPAGKPAPCVGRERELGALEALFDESASESVGRAMLVTGAAGVGKSRLVHELVRRLRARGEPVEIWMAGGDPRRADVPFGLLRQIIAQAADLREGDLGWTQQQKLRARVARHVEASMRARVAELLGEIVGVRSTERSDTMPPSDRSSATLVGEQMRRAWVDFVDAECRAHPVLLILEDLHWGDLPTVQYVDAALRCARDRSLMVLALARPAVRDLFPDFWSKRGLSEITLGALTRKPCEQLIRHVLGEDVPAETIGALWDRSAGNAFFLEELLRAGATPSSAAPPTVVAMLESRIAGLGPRSRRILRAGSVFGQVFWRGALAALLGEDAGQSDLDEQLSALEEGEWIAEQTAERFPGEREYVFRHALLREAAYGMLTDDDRRLGHRLAGEWLERAGEPSGAALARHFELGGDASRAAALTQRPTERNQELGG